ASGRNAYTRPMTAYRFGSPETVGVPAAGPSSPSLPPAAGGGSTATEKAGSDTTLAASETEIRISRWSPTSSSRGVPCSVPVAGSNSAHAGRLAIVSARRSPPSSIASGVNAGAEDGRGGNDAWADRGGGG